ncbi:MAG: GNAT family N-acetyltransferase [Maritimibacter sp.]
MSNRQNLITRRAGPADAEGLAHLHVAVWRQTYAALAPAEALEMLDEANRLPGWQAALAPDAPKSAGGTLIAELDGRAVGFVRYGPASQPELGDAGEVKHLYVLPDYARRGIGQRLLSEAFAGLRAMGFEVAVLAVVAGNDAALGFYQAQGAERAGRFVDAGPLWRSDNLILRWAL